MVRLFAGALLCIVCSPAQACDAMRSCYSNGKPLTAFGPIVAHH